MKSVFYILDKNGNGAQELSGAEFRDMLNAYPVVAYDDAETTERLIDVLNAVDTLKDAGFDCAKHSVMTFDLYRKGKNVNCDDSDYLILNICDKLNRG